MEDDSQPVEEPVNFYTHKHVSPLFIFESIIVLIFSGILV